MRTNSRVFGRSTFTLLKNQAKMGISPKEQRRIEDLNRGVKLIWPYINSFCLYADSFPVQKIQIRFLS
jgi:hypothetical protein